MSHISDLSVRARDSNRGSVSQRQGILAAKRRHSVAGLLLPSVSFDQVWVACLRRLRARAKAPSPAWRKLNPKARSGPERETCLCNKSKFLGLLASGREVRGRRRLRRSERRAREGHAVLGLSRRRSRPAIVAPTLPANTASAPMVVTGAASGAQPDRCCSGRGVDGRRVGGMELAGASRRECGCGDGHGEFDNQKQHQPK